VFCGKEVFAWSHGLDEIVGGLIVRVGKARRKFIIVGKAVRVVGIHDEVDLGRWVLVSRLDSIENE
jgi:hypothetical protein